MIRLHDNYTHFLKKSKLFRYLLAYFQKKANMVFYLPFFLYERESVFYKNIYNSTVFVKF